LQQIRRDIARDDQIARALRHQNVAELFARDALRHQRAEKVAVRQRIFLAIRAAERRHVLALVGLLLPVGQKEEHSPLRALKPTAEGAAVMNGGGVQ